MFLLPPTWWHNRLLPKCTYFQYTYIWVWMGWQNSIPISWKVLLVMKLLVLLCCLVLDSLFTNSCHKLNSIRKHACASWTTNTSCPKFYELWFWMRNGHHRLSHACLKDCYLVNVNKNINMWTKAGRHILIICHLC